MICLLQVIEERNNKMKKRILSIMLFLAGIIAGAEIVTCQRVRQHKKDYAVIMKNDSIIKMFNQWLIIKQEGKSVDARSEEHTSELQSPS